MNSNPEPASDDDGLTPSPAALWFQAQREHPNEPELRRSRFQSLMRLHGHIVPKTPENEPRHSHVTRDIKPCGSGCPACDEYHWQRRAAEIRER